MVGIHRHGRFARAYEASHKYYGMRRSKIRSKKKIKEEIFLDKPLDEKALITLNNAGYKFSSHIGPLSRCIDNIDKTTYDNLLSVNILRKYKKILDEKWEEGRKKIEIETETKTKTNAKVVAKPIKKIAVPRMRRRSRMHRRSRGVIHTRAAMRTRGLGKRPSLVFANFILRLFINHQGRYERKIKTILSESCKKKNKKTLLENIRNKFAQNAEYFTKFAWNYRDVWGCTKELVSNLINSHNIFLVVAFYRLDKNPDEFCSKYINTSIITQEEYDILKNNLLPIHRDLKLLLSFGSEEDVLKHISEFSSSEIVKNIKFIKHESVRDHIIKTDSIKIDKKVISGFLKNLNTDMLISLIKNKKYNPKKADIDSILVVKKNPRDRYQYMHRRRVNKRFSASNCKKINKFLLNMIKCGVKIHYSKGLLNYLNFYSNIETLFGILDSKNIPGYKFDSKIDNLKKIANNKRNNIIISIIEKDDLDNFKKVIDSDLLKITDLHRYSADNYTESHGYVATAINKSSFKILRYMIDDLKVKPMFRSSHDFLGWRFFYSHKDDEVLELLKKLKEYNIPIPGDILVKCLEKCRHKSVKFLFEECDLNTKISAEQINKMNTDIFDMYVDYLKKNGKNINLSGIASQLIKYNYKCYRKNKDIYKLIKHIIDKEPENFTRQKIANKIFLLSLEYDSEKVFSMIKSNYTVDITCKQILKIIKSENNKSGLTKMFDILNKHFPKKVKEIKNMSEDLKVKLFFGNSTEDGDVTYYYRYRNEGYDPGTSIKKYTRICSEYSIDNFKNMYRAVVKYYDNGGKKTIILVDNEIANACVKYIHKIPEYTDFVKSNFAITDKSYDTIKSLLDYLVDNGGLYILNILDDIFSIYDKLSLKQIHGLCMGSINMYCSIGDFINILSRASKYHKITPYIWSVLAVGINVYKETDGWFNFRYHSKNIYKLLNLFPEITQKDYDSIIKSGLYSISRKENKQFEQIVKIVDYNYDELDINDMHDDYLYYKEIYGRNVILRNYDDSYDKNTDSCDTEDMEKALENAEKELKEEFGDELDEELKNDENDNNENENNDNENNDNENNEEAEILNLNRYKIIKKRKIVRKL